MPKFYAGLNVLAAMVVACLALGVSAPVALAAEPDPSLLENGDTAWLDAGVAVETDLETGAAFQALGFADRPGSTAERLRLQRSGDQITSSYWTGDKWTTAASATVAFDTIQVGLYALGALNGTSMSAAFDSFSLDSSVTTTTPPSTSCATSSTAEGLTPVLQLDVPAFAAWQQKPRYAYDGTDAFQGAVDRVGYCLETVINGQTQWVWTSMESFTPDVSELGIPTQAGDVVRQRVDDLLVASNVPGVRTGAEQTGYLEMWPNSYEPKTSRQVAGSSSETFDADDAPQPGRYGSFQVSSIGAQPNSAVLPSTALAINHLGVRNGSVTTDR